MDLSKSSTTKFFLLNPTKEKAIISFFNSLIVFLVALIIPSLGFQSVFLSRELPGQIMSFVMSLLFSFVVYYPFSCGLVYLFKIITGKEVFKVQNLVFALLFLLIFNIITFSMVVSTIVKNRQINAPSKSVVIDPNTKEKLCGLQIVEATAPSSKNAGLLVGEVIKTIDDFSVNDMGDLTHALVNKRANDTVVVVTNVNTYNVPLFANPQNPQQVLMGIKLKLIECGK